MKRQTFFATGLLMLAMLLLMGCNAIPGAGGKPTIRIGSKEFTEQHLLGNMYTMLLENEGFEVEYTPLGGTLENHQALIEDQIDIYPEYTGTILLTVLEEEFDPSMSADDVYSTAKAAYEEQFDLTLLQPTQFNNTYCLTMPQARAQELGISTVSELSVNSEGLIFGTTQEFTERADGLPGLREHYGGFDFAEVRALDPGLLYSGLDEGQIDVTTCFGTDGQIAALDLVVLEDDQNFWPPYPAAPVVRQEVLDANPEIADALNKLAPLLDGPTMQRLNWEVAGNGREADEVAHEFLVENGLIEE